MSRIHIQYIHTHKSTRAILIIFNRNHTKIIHTAPISVKNAQALVKAGASFSS
jgi:hypothetical protein